MVGHALKHYSAVDVTVVGEAITEEIPYKVSNNPINPNPSFLDMLGIQFLGGCQHKIERVCWYYLVIFYTNCKLLGHLDSSLR